MVNTLISDLYQLQFFNSLIRYDLDVSIISGGKMEEIISEVELMKKRIDKLGRLL